MVGSNLIDTKQVTHVKRKLFNYAQSVLSLGFWLFVWLFLFQIFLIELLSSVRVWTYIVVVLLQYLYKLIF